MEKQYQFLHDCITPNLSDDFKKEYQFICEVKGIKNA